MLFSRPQFLAHRSREEVQDTQIKICGITNTVDALNAASLGADAIGMIFYPPSSRNLDCSQAAAVRNCLPETVSSIAVVVDPGEDLVFDIVSQVKPDFIQYHGFEPPELCDDVGIPYIKAVRVRSTEQILQTIESYANAKAFLLDAYEKDRVGGTGRKFSWDLIPQAQVPIILAGGLNAENVGEAIGQVHPLAVDVSTSVEASGGRKDRTAMEQFIFAVRSADRCSSEVKVAS